MRGAVDPVLTTERLRQLVATQRNGLRVFQPFSALSHLPPVATGCDRSAEDGFERLLTGKNEVKVLVKVGG